MSRAVGIVDDRLLSIVVLLALLLLPQKLPGQSNAQGTLSVAGPISDHMVLQQGQETSIWGVASPNAQVEVEFGQQRVSGQADGEGRWRVKLKPMSVNAKPQSIKVSSGKESLEVSDVLVGEVWMCSGQSNMAWTMARSNDSAIADANLPQVRIFTTPSKTSQSEEYDCGGQWETVTPESAANFSAVAFHFGRKLNQELNVPVGLINTAWGGKPVEAFTRRSKLESIPQALPLLEEWDDVAAAFQLDAATKKYEASLAAWKARVQEIRQQAKDKGQQPRLPRRPQPPIQPQLDPNFPSAIYNYKVAPWTGYAIAGAIWYQGESNRARAAQYEYLLAGMIEDWRDLWGHELPFYIVQLANYQQPSTEPGVPDDWAELQNSQTMVAEKLNRCGIAVINDIGEANDIHPKNKKDVGLRLALLALHNDYGKAIDPYSSPLYDSHEIVGSNVKVKFKHVGDGLRSRDEAPLKRFEIAGEDQKWHWADAKIEGSDVVKVSSSKVTKPVAVRYAWASNPQGANLVNSAGLPASLFRTDNWPLNSAGRMTRRNPADTMRAMMRQGFKPLFNGKDLNGWRNPYQWGEAKVVNGEIHLTGNKKFFLVTHETYDDFRLIVEVKLPKGKANSGIMFRCHAEPNKVYGYQAEVDGSERRWSGGFYDEGRRSWIWPSTKGRSQEEFLKYEAESKAHFAKPEVRDALKRDGWNRYEITCRGDRISIKVNGVETSKVRDDTDAEGFIGIQHHGEKGQTYRFRNLFIKPLG